MKITTTITITITEALRNYLRDLEYNGVTCDRENLNYVTEGTPEFETDAEMNAYIDAIASLLAKQEDEE